MEKFGDELRHELSEWERSNRIAKFWWRDDDAVSATSALHRLLALAEQIGTTVALAVIPERADESLANLVGRGPCCVWQHGLRHHWEHEDPEGKYAQGEFGEGRELSRMMADAHHGQIALDRLFGQNTWQKVFVPPFHALSNCFKGLLPSLGYWGLSSGLPLSPPIGTVKEVNAEIDVMNWPERAFHGAEAVEKMIVEQLQSRRQVSRSRESPIGLLTHHLVHDDETWDFIAELFRFLNDHDAAVLVPANLLFQQAKQFSTSSTVASAEVTFVVTSCGRQDLLEITLDSFLRYNTYLVKEFIVIEDGDGSKNQRLIEKYRERPFHWLATGHRVGQVAAIDIAYQAVQTDYIFHCEDDWEFHAPGFIEKSFAILQQNPSILQVWIRALNDTNGHPMIDYTLHANGVPYRLLSHFYEGKRGIWHGFSWNPGLRRRQDYTLIGSFSSLDPMTSRETWCVEGDASTFYQRRGLFAAILADNSGAGYVRHIGGGRRVPRDYLRLQPHSEQPDGARSCEIQTEGSSKRFKRMG